MHLFRHKNSPYWQCSFYDRDGVLQKESTKCTDKKAAAARATAFERDASDPHSARQSRATLKEALMLLLKDRAEQARVGKKSADTVAFYTRKAGQLLRFFEHQGEGFRPRTPFLLSQMSAAWVDDYISFRRGEVKHPHSTALISESTISKELICLRAALKIAKRRGLWAGDLGEVMPVGFSPEYEPRSRCLTYEEVQLLLPQLTPDRAARVAFSIATSACWRETELGQKSDIEALQVLLRGTKTANRYRTVPIALDFQKLLLTYARKHAEGEGEMLFVPWGNVRRDLHAACERAKIPACSPNDLRRTCATWLRAAGVPLELLPPLLGHKDSKMAERVYGRLPVSDLRNRMLAAVYAHGTPAEHDKTIPNGHTGQGEDTSPNDKTPLPVRPGAGFDLCPETELNRRHGDFQSPALLLPLPSNASHLIKYRKASTPAVRQTPANRGGVS